MFDKLPTYKTINGMTAKEIISKAEICETKSNDYLFFCGDLELNLTDNYELVISGCGTGLCVMDLDDDLINKMIEIQENINKMYIKAHLLSK